MIDANGHRQFIIPAEVKGFFKTRKKYLHFFLLIIFLAIPWIRIHDQQIILLNIAERKFQFFGLVLHAHDAPLTFFVLLGLAAGLALVTALFGRVWCGWACPQTVFIESLFRQVEIWTEGNYIERRKLMAEEMSFRKFRKTGLKWFLYFTISFLISHSFLAYWTGSKELLQMMESGPRDNLFYFTLVSAMTALVLFNFGWFREQFCLIVCPYGKFQSVLLDSHTINVMYDEKRGEPRKGKPGAGGDCVSCQRCVQVCPTGIDIRNGLQMECIGCTACIDACDDIMRKVKKPEGLIRYKPLTNNPVKWFRTRVIAYFSAFVFSVTALSISLAYNSDIRIEIMRGHGAPYTLVVQDEETVVQNQFMLRIENSSNINKRFQVQIVNANAKLTIPENPLMVGSGKKRDTPLFIQRPLESSQEIQLSVTDLETSVEKKLKIQLVGP